MYLPVLGVRLIHYWNKENEQCLVKICMGIVNIIIYHRVCEYARHENRSDCLLKISYRTGRAICI